ncbi:MAG: tetratricopeptide repeat protein [Allosphingosinicella sp.]
MTVLKLSLAAAAALDPVVSVLAAQAVVLGHSSARLCYEAADSRGATTKQSLDRCDQALAEEALSRHDEVATYVNRGILKLRQNRIDAAIADFDAAIARDPDQAEAYLNKGVASLRREQWAQALPLFDTALAKETIRPAIAHYGRAVAHEMGGNVRQAYNDYREASRLAPKWRDPQVELSRFTVVSR